MLQIDPLVFGAAVLILVASAIFVPRVFSREKGDTADDIYVNSLPSYYDRPAPTKKIVVPATTSTSTQPPVAAGAPIAASPARVEAEAPAGAPADGRPAPLKLPA
jgi:hypothetical protein